jgi:hypothetical protein
MPILKNGHFCRSESFESHHQQTKQTLTDFRAQGGSLFEQRTMRQMNIEDALKFTFRGGRWGPDLQYTIGESLLQLKDYAQGKQHLPHPIFSTITHRIINRNNTNYESNWIAYGFSYIDHKNYKIIDERAPNQDEIKQLQFAFAEYYPEHKVSFLPFEIKYQWVSGFIDAISNRRRILRCGDDVSVLFHDNIEYLQVQKCLIVHSGKKIFSFIFPLWYNKIHSDSIQLVCKWEQNRNYLMPLPANTIQEQVITFHNCKRRCTCGKKSRCSCDNICKTNKVCQTHYSPNCAECVKSSFVEVDLHTTFNEFMVFDSSYGFQLDL